MLVHPGKKYTLCSTFTTLIYFFSKEVETDREVKRTEEAFYSKKTVTSDTLVDEINYASTSQKKRARVSGV